MNSVRTCEKCHTSGTVEQMVGCDMCDIWLHMKCAGVTTDNADPDKSWRCERCLHDEATERTSHRSRKTSRTTSSILAQRTELALQLLDEEQALIKRNREREDEFLKKEAEMQRKRAEEDAKLLKQKHDLLKSLEDGNGSIRSGISSIASRRRVQEWLGTNSGGLVTVTEQPQMSGPTAQLSATPSEISALPIMPPRKSDADVLLSQDAEGSTIAPKSTSTPQKTLRLYAQAQFGQRMDGSSNPVVTAANVSLSDVHQVSRSRYPVPSGVQQQNEPVQSASTGVQPPNVSFLPAPSGAQQFNVPLQQAPSGAQMAARQKQKVYLARDVVVDENWNDAGTGVWSQMLSLKIRFGLYPDNLLRRIKQNQL
nr:PHD finger protein At3g20280-like [Aedes albopictus]